MREILFRGKRIDNDEWGEGLPIKTYDTEIGKSVVDYAKPIPVVLMASGRIVLGCGYDEIPYFNTDDYPIVDPATISEFTGLKDRNGTKIFEGDILSAHLDDAFPNEETRGCVCWNDYGWHINIRSLFDTLEGDWVSRYFEVIGNIHDNPELLEGWD